MPIKKIITIPDPFLRKKAFTIKKITSEIKRLLDDMLETMYAAKGIGLAATQIRDDRRLIVIDCGRENLDKNNRQNNKFIPNPIKMINPELILTSNDHSEREEGCLSIPGYYGKVKRPKTIEVSYLNENNVKEHIKADGLLSACIQHEIDHLNGVLFVDHLSKLKKEMILNKVSKELKKNINRD